MPKPTKKATTAAAAAGDIIPTAAQDAPLIFNTSIREDGNTLVEVSVQPIPEGLGANGRRPADIVCVVDISGSMDSICTEPDEDGECDNLTRLDLVKHSVRAVIAMLKPEDRFGLVTFSSCSTEVMQLTKMDKAGRTQATALTDALSTKGTTNLWAGLRDGLRMAAQPCLDRFNATSAVMLLTDGVPNEVHGLDEVVAEFKSAKTTGDLKRSSPPLVSTFGFGYSLNTPLLAQIANAFNGTHTFIPDASFVGTAFVNNTSALLSTVAQGCTLTFESMNNSDIVDVVGCYPENGSGKGEGGAKTVCSTSRTIELGPCMLGQSRNACIILKTTTAGADAGADAGVPVLKVTFEHVQGNGPTATTTKHEAELMHSGEATGNPAEAQVQQLRLEAAEVFAAVPTQYVDAGTIKAGIEAMVAKIASSEVAADPRVVALLADLQGQVTEAISKSEWYQKWGQHYLPSLSRSHTLQQCTNFKDPGLQVYGGAIFKATRDEGDDVFVDLPPPTATGNSYRGGGGGGGGGGASRSAPIDMSRYYNQSGGCFKPGCAVTMVDMADGTITTKPVEEVQRGDRVMTRGTRTSTSTSTSNQSAAAATTPASATVVCVVKTRCPGGVTPLVTLGGGAGPTLTQYHPVCIAGAWAFPGSLAETTMQKADYVYTYLLEEGAPSMWIDGMECCSLGHGLGADVVRHAYLGSHAAVTADLEQLPGWDAGLVLLEPDSFVRAAGSGQICAIKPAATAAADVAAAVHGAATATATAAAAATAAYLPLRCASGMANDDADTLTTAATMATAVPIAC